MRIELIDMRYLAAAEKLEKNLETSQTDEKKEIQKRIKMIADSMMEYV